MGSPSYFGKLVNFEAASRKNALIPFGSFSPGDNLSFIASLPAPAAAPYAVVPVSFATHLVIDVSLGTIFDIPVTGNIASTTLNFIISPTAPDGTPVILRYNMDNTGGHTVALPANLILDAGVGVDPGAGRTTVFPIYYNSTNWVLNGASFSVTGS